MIKRNKFELLDLANEILDEFPDQAFLSKTTKFLDPSMGGGQFVYAIEQRLRAYGHSDKNISQRVFGFEGVLMDIRYAVNKFKLVGNYQVLKPEDFINSDFDIVFDYAVSNPTYSGKDTSREGISHRGQGNNIAKKITLKTLSLLSETGQMAIAMPYGHRTYSVNLAKKYQSLGLYRIDDVSDKFASYWLNTSSCVFYFNRNNVVDKVEDNFKNHNLQVPTQNIGQLFKNQPGVLNRADYEHTLSDKGKHRIVVTTAIQKYTNNKTLVKDMKDPTVGNWRVVFNCTTSVGKFGRIIVEGPDSILSKSVHCLICDSEPQANALKSYLETQEVGDILQTVKLSACNSRKFLQYIPMPVSA